MAQQFNVVELGDRRHHACREPHTGHGLERSWRSPPSGPDNPGTVAVYRWRFGRRLTGIRTPGSGHARSRRRSREGPTPRLPPLAGRSPAVTGIHSAHAFAATAGARRAEPVSQGSEVAAAVAWAAVAVAAASRPLPRTHPLKRRLRSRRRSPRRQWLPLNRGNRQGNQATVAGPLRRQRRPRRPWRCLRLPRRQRRFRRPS